MAPEDLLRRCVLAVTVLDDVDLLPLDSGVRVGTVSVPWAECGTALDGAPPTSDAARDRLSRHLRVRSTTTALVLRPYAVPRYHPLHPGPAWTRRAVLGGALDVGYGVLGLDPRQPQTVLALPPHAGVEVDAAALAGYLSEMGALAAERMRQAPELPLRPMGDCDVVTLLADAGFRAALAAPTGGLRSAAVPTRDRGWLDLRRVDPAFAAAAAAATEVPRRGFARPILVTADEVTLAREPPGRAAAAPVARAG